MQANLGFPAHPNEIQFMVGFESRIQPLYCRPPIEDHLEGGILALAIRSPLVRGIGVNDGHRMVVTADRPSKFVAGISFVADDVLGQEAAISEPSLCQKRGCLVHIMDVPRRDVHGDGKFVLRITEDMGLVPPNVLSATFGVLLHRPTSVGVGGLPILSLLPAMRPCLDISAINGDGLSKVWQFGEHAPHHLAMHVLDRKESRELGEFGAEARERRLTRNLVGRIDTAGTGDVGIIIEEPNQGRDRFQAQSIVSYVAMPEDANIVSWPSTPHWAFELGEQFVVGEFREDCFKLCDNWWSLRLGTRYLTIGQSHREAHSFRWSGAVGVTSTRGSACLLEQAYYYDGSLSSIFAVIMGEIGTRYCEFSDEHEPFVWWLRAILEGSRSDRLEQNYE